MQIINRSLALSVIALVTIATAVPTAPFGSAIESNNVYKRSEGVDVDNIYKRDDLWINSVQKMKRETESAKGALVDDILLKREEQSTEGALVDNILLKRVEQSTEGALVDDILLKRGNEVD